MLIVGQAEQDVVADGSGHDPGCLWAEGDPPAVSDLPLRWDQLSQDHHEQRALEKHPKSLLAMSTPACMHTHTHIFSPKYKPNETTFNLSELISSWKLNNKAVGLWLVL